MLHIDHMILPGHGGRDTPARVPDTASSVCGGERAS